MEGDDQLCWLHENSIYPIHQRRIFPNTDKILQEHPNIRIDPAIKKQRRKLFLNLSLSDIVQKLKVIFDRFAIWV